MDWRRRERGATLAPPQRAIERTDLLGDRGRCGLHESHLDPPVRHVQGADQEGPNRHRQLPGEELRAAVLGDGSLDGRLLFVVGGVRRD